MGVEIFVFGKKKLRIQKYPYICLNNRHKDDDASSHHRIFAIRNGSDSVEDYLENHLLGAFTPKSMKIEPVVQGKEFFCFLPSLLYLFLCIFFFFLRILSEMTTPFVARTLAKYPKYVAYVMVGADQ